MTTTTATRSSRKATALTTAAAVEARRTELFRLEAAGQPVTEAMWDEVAFAQQRLNAQAFGPDGYVRHDYHR